MFKKSLQDMVKGIRGSKGDDRTYIQSCLADIRKEVKSPDVAVKAQALQKLTYVRCTACPALPLRACMVSLGGTSTTAPGAARSAPCSCAVDAAAVCVLCHPLRTHSPPSLVLRALACRPMCGIRHLYRPCCGTTSFTCWAMTRPGRRFP